MPRLLDNPEDFFVEEIPAFQASGAGAFTWVHIEKYNLHTDAVVQDLAKHLNIPQRSIGYAGKKDKRSQSLQYFSVPGNVIAGLPREPIGEHSWWQIRQAQLHDHPLKLGQIHGNAFRLSLADCDAQFVSQVACLQETQLLNLYGPQRFGCQGHNILAAKSWAAGDYQCCVDILIDGQQQQQGLMRSLQKHLARGLDAKTALNRSGKRLRQFMASVLQSAIFNTIAAARAAAGLCAQVQEGDLLLRQGKSPFHARADELAQLQQDMDAAMISTTAPLPGYKVRQPGVQVQQQEQAWAAVSDIAWSCFEKGAVFASPGERRRLLVQFLQEPVFDATNQELRFALPAGSYASTVLDALQVAHNR